ncbi:MAG TPA: Hpt domain-containing protein, partial [Roseiflexaceae bacterium]|nr:Hpt domain-containing protein [Roseiflexaceae bacterium]
PAALRRLTDMLGDEAPQVLPSLVQAYSADAAALCEAAREGLVRHRAEAVHRAMHGLKSNSETFGALALAGLCRDLERRAWDGELAGAEAALAEIEAECARVQQALHELVGNAEALRE